MNGSQDTELLVILRFRKIVLHNIILNKMPTTKNQENSIHCFEDKHLTSHPAKILRDRIKPYRVGALRVSIGYNFFYKKHLVKVS